MLQAFEVSLRRSCCPNEHIHQLKLSLSIKSTSVGAFGTMTPSALPMAQEEVLIEHPGTGLQIESFDMFFPLFVHQMHTLHKLR